ncbi:hypothetical protein WR25_22817 [Diploscapter pachys]|uniref:Uncharacterized protein n=1 Tax=Diploscapter pachys TaxID=2018661 RepID=A0A2A2JJN2_9BILA|nr:hypothetical protein WR25_22817 [Diploscapter pachys]
MSPIMGDNKITPDLTSFKGDWNNMQPPEPQMILPEMKQLPILENLDEAESSKLESPYPGFLPNLNQNLEDRNFDPDKFFNEKFSQKDYQGLTNLINSLPSSRRFKLITKFQKLRSSPIVSSRRSIKLWSEE